VCPSFGYVALLTQMETTLYRTAAATPDAFLTVVGTPGLFSTAF
jgi:hypothetical protein